MLDAHTLIQKRWSWHLFHPWSACPLNCQTHTEVVLMKFPSKQNTQSPYTEGRGCWSPRASHSPQTQPWLPAPAARWHTMLAWLYSRWHTHFSRWAVTQLLSLWTAGTARWGVLPWSWRQAEITSAQVKYCAAVGLTKARYSDPAAGRSPLGAEVGNHLCNCSSLPQIAIFLWPFQEKGCQHIKSSENYRVCPPPQFILQHNYPNLIPSEGSWMIYLLLFT